MSELKMKVDRQQFKDELIAEIERAKDKSNFTFVLSKRVVKQFKYRCGKDDLSMSAVLEAFMRSYNGVDKL